jgi:hypothetical protein
VTKSRVLTHWPYSCSPLPKSATSPWSQTSAASFALILAKPCAPTPSAWTPSGTLTVLLPKSSTLRQHVPPSKHWSIIPSVRGLAQPSTWLQFRPFASQTSSAASQLTLHIFAWKMLADRAVSDQVSQSPSHTAPPILTSNHVLPVLTPSQSELLKF